MESYKSGPYEKSPDKTSEEEKEETIREKLEKGEFISKEEAADFEVSHRATKITLARIDDYQELWAETEKEGDKKFNEKTRELWKDFVTHGVIGLDKKTGEKVFLNYSDLDGKSSLALLRLAGINTKDVEYVEPGKFKQEKINLDTGGRHGLVLEDEGKTVFMDHHADESGRDTSATKVVYQTLTSLGLLKKEKYLNEMVEFVTQIDNRTYPISDEKKYFFEQSWQTILGLQRYVQPKHLINFFRAGKSPTDILENRELKEMGLLEGSKEQRETVKSSLAELEKMERDGLIVFSRRYGRIAVDIGKKVKAGFDAARAYGCGAYFIWNRQEKSFFIATKDDLTDTFSQGMKVREQMWIKPRNDKEPLTIELEEILSKMTDGELKPEGKLKEYLEKEVGATKENRLPQWIKRLAEEKSEAAPKTEEKVEIKEQPESSYSKEEWFEIAETLKEQAAVSREKEKIEEKEENIELIQDAAAIQLGGVEDFNKEKKIETIKEKKVEPKEPERPEQPPKPEKAEINNLTRLCKSVREGRRELAESEIEWKNLMAKGMPGYEKFPKNKNAKELYNDSRKQLIKYLLTKAERRWGKDSEKFNWFRDELGFKGFVGKEYERLQKAKKEAMEPKEKGRLRKLYEATTKQFAKMPKTVRWGIAAGIGTAVALGTGGIALPAALGYAGFRFGRAALGSFSAVGAKALGDMAEKQWLKKHGKEAREKKIKESLRKEAANISDVEKISDIVMEKTDKRNEELVKLVKRQKQWRVGKMAAMIGAGAGVSFVAGSMDSFSHEPQVVGGVKDHLGIKPDKPQTAQLFERAEESRFIGRPQAEIFERAEESRFIGVIPEQAKFAEFIETIKPGDSVWKIAERNLESHGYFKGLTGTPEEIAAKKDYLTDWVKDQVVENKTKFGLIDPDKLTPGQKFDLSDILKNKREALLGEINKAENLSIGQMKHIIHNRELNTEWLKNHPGEALTTPKVAEILGGKRLEILTQEKPSTGMGEILAEPQEQGIEVVQKEGIEVSAEDYLRGLNQEDREMIDSKWEDYNELPPLSEDELRGLEDYYEDKGDWTLGLFYDQQAKLHEDIIEILAPSKLRISEYIAIKNVTVGKFLEETAGGWEKWRSDEAITINLPHDGIYGASEYGRQLELAKFLRGTRPTTLGKMLTVEEYLKNFIK